MERPFLMTLLGQTSRFCSHYKINGKYTCPIRLIRCSTNLCTNMLQEYIKLWCLFKRTLSHYRLSLRAARSGGA